MSDLNVTTIMGRLVRNPVLKNGRTRMGFFTIASNQRYRDEAGVLQEETAFLACKVFGAWTDVLTDCRQGDMLLGTGRLRSETWEKDGVKRTQLVLICNSLHSICPSRGSTQCAREPEPATASAKTGSNSPADQGKLPF